MRFFPTLLIGFAVALSPVAVAAQEGAAPPPAVLDEAKVPGIMEKAVDAVIRPGYRTFHAAAGRLTTAMTTLCGDPTAAALGHARTAFADTVVAWSTIEIVRIGPVLGGNRFERILFYPDRKGTGLKQVQALLASPDEKDTTAAAVAGKSVAIQGLGALEYILYGTGADALTTEKAGFRCRYGAAVAGNIEAVAADLTAAWEKPDGIQAAWKHPGPDNPEFRTPREAITALLGILVHSAETIRDQRLESFYRGKDAPLRPKSAIYWRSGLTWASIDANLAGLQTLFLKSGIDQLLDPSQRSVASSANFVIKSLVRTASTIDSDIAKAVADPTEQAKLDFLLLNTRDLILRLNDNLGGAVGLSAGFSFSDGD